MSVSYFCRHCWREVHAAAFVRPACGAQQDEWLSYREKLELALTCPEAQTARRAAFLLGEIADPRSVPALRRAVGNSDPYVAAEAVLALGRIQTMEAHELVVAALRHRFATVRAAARTAAKSSV